MSKSQNLRKQHQGYQRLISSNLVLKQLKNNIAID